MAQKKASPAARYIGGRLEEARTAAGMSRKQAAASLGISAVHLWRIERGKRGVSVERIQVMAILYATTVAILLGAEPFAPPTEAAT